MSEMGGNEIEFITRLVPAGDEAAVLRAIGERGYEGLVEALSARGIQLPPIDTAQFEASLARITQSLEQRNVAAAEKVGMAWREAYAAATTPVAGAAHPEQVLQRSMGTIPLGQAQGFQELIAQQERLNFTQATLAETSTVAEQHMANEAAAAEALQARIMGLTDAERALEVATLRLNAAMETGSLEQRMQALNRFNAAQRAVDEEAARAVRAQNTSHGFLANAWSGFTTGRGLFHNAEDSDINALKRTGGQSGEFLGAIARYQAAYALIFGITAGFSALVRAEAQAQDAMIELGHATGETGDQLNSFGSDLAAVVAQAGGSAATAIQTATRGIYAFRNQIPNQPGSEEPRKAAVEHVGVVSAQTAAMAQLLTGAQDVNQAQQQLIATTLSYNLGADEQTRVLDAAANAARNYGTGIDQLLIGLPSLAETANAAGLSIEQVSNIMSVAISRSNQTGTGVASLLNRAIGSINERPDTRPTLAAMGVDTSGTAGQVLESLTVRWKHLSDAQQQAAMTALGGHEVARALLPILNEGRGLLDANAKSYANGGYAAELYYQRLNNLAGLLRTVGGDFQRLGYDLAQTGAVDIFGAMLKSVHPLLSFVDDLFRLFDLIPGSVRHWIVPLGEVLLILNAIGKTMARNAAIQAATNVETAVQAEEQAVIAAEQSAGGVKGFISRFRGRGGVVGGLGEEATAARAGIGMRAGFAALGDALLGPAGAVVGLVALAGATGAVINSYHAEQQARQQAADAEKQFRTSDSADELRAAASALSNAAVEQQHANSGFGGMFVADPSDRSRPEWLRQQAAYANSQATAIEAEQERLAGSARSLTTFFTTSDNAANDLASGLDAMAKAGVPAVRQLQLFNQELLGIGAAGGPGGAGGDPLGKGVYGTQTVVASLVGSVLNALGNAAVGKSDMTSNQVGRYQETFKPHHWYDYINPFGSGSPAGVQAMDDMGLAAKWTQEQLRGTDPSKVRDQINKTLEQHHVGALQLIDPALQTTIANEVITALGLNDVLKGVSRDRLAAQIRDALGTQFTNLATGGSPVTQMTDAEFQSFVTGIGADGKQTDAGSLAQRLQALAGTDDPRSVDPSLARLRAQTQALQTFVQQAQAQGFGGAGLAELMGLLHQSQHDLAVAAVEHLERLRQAAVAAAGDNVAAQATANAKYVLKEVRAAVARDDMGELLAVLNTADQATLDAVKKALQLEYRTAQESYDHAMAVYNEARAAWLALPAGIKNVDPTLAPVTPQMDPKGKRAKHILDQINALSPVTVPTDSGSSASTDDPNAARLAAQGVSGDPVSEARAQLRAAKYTLDHAKANTTEYWNALKAYHDAERQLADAIAARAEARENAHSRPGNALSAAKSAVDAARTALQEQIEGTAAWWQAWQQLQDAQYAAGQAAQEHAHQVRLAHLDQTDPVAVAREELRQAARRLHYDQRHGTGDIAADSAALNSARARAQGAVFDQRFHDVQVAHDLGEMSDAAYMRYLENQRSRLQAISHKTRQQIEELQQIDQAIKSAADTMQGQWNIGDIRIPTPYEARRYITATNAGLTYTGAAAGGGMVATHNSYEFKINGADTAAVRALLVQLLGPSVVRTTSTTTRKV